MAFGEEEEPLNQEPHALFPPTDEADEEALAPIVSEILVTRVEFGRKVTAPRAFKGEEIQTLADLYTMFGGGDYELIARHRNRISARRRHTLPGPPKPMYDASGEPVKVASPHQPQSPVMGNSPMPGLPSDGGIMALLMSMMQMMMQAQQASSQQTTSIMLAMMNGGSERTKEHMQEMRLSYERNSELQRQANESTMNMMRELSAAKNAGGSADETFFRGVEFMRSFSQSQIEMAKAAAKESGDDGLEGLLQTVMQGIEGFKAFQDVKNAANGAPSEVVP